jgi:uncharacterized iron-regulated membrane protein
LAFFALYIPAMGVFTQAVDLQALLRHAPATDPTMQAIRVGHDGPPNFQVIRDMDYAAQPLPANFDFDGALATVLKGARLALADAPITFVELRMSGGRPVGQAAFDHQVYRFDASSGAVMGPPRKLTLAAMEQPSLRNAAKSLHRMSIMGWWAYLLDLFVGVAILVMIVTGMTVYMRMVMGRAATGRKALFWSAGGWWRTLHRAVALVAALFITVVALSGVFLAVNALGINISKALKHGVRPGLTVDASSPLSDGQLPSMLHTTLTAYRHAHPGAGLKVLRLRYFAGMPQGVVITDEPTSRQLVFNAQTGRAVSETEPGYPDTDMPFGWQIGQIAKQIHRGDILGLPGRWMDLLSGLSLVYLGASGVVIYVELWRKRRSRGRHGLFWA